jgi:hypothetical protein
MFSNKIHLLIFSTWILLWFGLGTHINDLQNFNNYNIKNVNFLRSNIILFIFFFLLIFFFFYNNITAYLIYSLYPIFGFFGFLLSEYDNYYDGFHSFISLLSVVLMMNFICHRHIDKKLIFHIFHYSMIFILIAYLLFIILPQFVFSVSNLSPYLRGEFVTNIILFNNFNLYIPQNSNGASRITFILFTLSLCLYYHQLKNKFTFKDILFLIIIILLAFTTIYYNSRLNIVMMICSIIFIFVSNENYKNKLKILSFLLILIFPFFMNYTYQKFVDKNYNLLTESRILGTSEGIYGLFYKNFIINKTNQISQIYNESETDLSKACSTHKSSLDNFFSGRLCGWEILIKSYNHNFKFFGYGFFGDRKLMKQHQKLSSNSFIFILYNAGILSFLSFVGFYLIIFLKTKNLYNVETITKRNKDPKIKFYIILSVYLLIRSIFEDTLAFISIDLLLMILLISSFNYYNNKKNFTIET